MTLIFMCNSNRNYIYDFMYNDTIEYQSDYDRVSM